MLTLFIDCSLLKSCFTALGITPPSELLRLMPSVLPDTSSSVTLPNMV